MTEQTPNTPPRIFKIGTTTIVGDESLAGKPLDEVTDILKRTYPEVAHATVRETTLCCSRPVVEPPRAHPANHDRHSGVRTMTEENPRPIGRPRTGMTAGNPCGMNDLLQTYTLLAAGLRDDPLLSLVSAVCWLDPMWQDDEDDWYEDDTLSIALSVTRKAFPDVYIEAVQAIRQGASYADLDRLICGAISERGIPLENLEWIGYGIPMPAYGAVLDDPDFYTTHPDTKPVLECFGISPEINPYHITVPECAYTAGRFIAADLDKHEDERYRQVAWLMQWLFSCSGNSSIDYSYEEHCEFQPLSWDKDDLAFALDIIEEADGIMADALAGLAFLNGQPELMNALQHNVQRIYKALERQKAKQGEPKVQLKWNNESTISGKPLLSLRTDT